MSGTAPRWHDAAAAAALVALTAALHHPALGGWWTWDDPEILLEATRFAPWQYALVPEVWWEQTAAFLTPLQTASFDLDLLLAGPRPGWFYAHHLLAAAAVAVATHALLRRWVTAPWAFAGGALFLCSAPLVSVRHALWCRHYLEGLLLAVVALALFVRAVERRWWAWLVPAGLAAAAAMAAKELFVLVPLVLPALPAGGARRRWRAAAPLLALIPLYLVWRRWMLGDWIGGYGAMATPREVLDLPGHLAAALYGGGVAGTAVGLAVVAVVALALWRLPSARWIVPVGLGVTLAPLVGIADMIPVAERLALPLAWCAGVALALTLGAVAADRPIRVAGAVLLLLAVATCGQVRGKRWLPAIEADGARFRAQGEPLAAGDGDAVVWSTGASMFVLRLAGVYAHHRGPDRVPEVVLDEIELQGRDLAGRRVLAFDREAGAMRDVGGDLPALLEAWERRVEERPLAVRLAADGGWIHLELGPYTEGRYLLLEPTRFGRHRTAPQRTSRVRVTEPIEFRVRYDDPGGWITYSPPLRFGGQPGEEVAWSRGVDGPHAPPAVVP